jgi:hypothetical protein
MIIIAHLSINEAPIADVTYRAGMHVEVRVAKEFQAERIEYDLPHLNDRKLKGSWEQALDRLFNEWTFDSSGLVFPGEMARVGTAREHKSLFRTATLQLRKDLAPLGYTLEVEFL